MPARRSTAVGNLDEVAALARLPHSCLCIWSGDHKQIREDQKRLMKPRPFARKSWGDCLGYAVQYPISTTAPASLLLASISEKSPDSLSNVIMNLSADQARHRPDCCLELEGVLGAPLTDDLLSWPVKRAALTVLWTSHNVGSLASPSLPTFWRRLAYWVATNGAFSCRAAREFRLLRIKR